MREIPWIFGRPMQPRLGGGAEAEFRRGALAEDGEAGGEITVGDGGVVVGNKILEQPRAEGGARVGQENRVLEQERNAAERTVGHAMGDLRASVVIVFDGDRIELRVEALGARDR